MLSRKYAVKNILIAYQEPQQSIIEKLNWFTEKNQNITQPLLNKEIVSKF